MPRRPHRMTLLAVAIAVTLLTACDETPATPTPGAPAPNATQASVTDPSTELPRLTENADARWTDVAVAADGTVHVVYHALDPASKRPQAYHRASSDGGATWGQATNLLADDTKSQAGFVRVAIDGEGRIYAFWKTYTGFDVVDPSGGNAGTLSYRVLSGGTWQPAVKVGTDGQVVSWFPAVAPDGRLHMVWSEPPLGDNNSYEADSEAGIVRRAVLTGATVTAPIEILRAKPVPVDGSTSVFNYDGYKGLDGYVDGADAVHFVALVKRANVGVTNNGDTELSYWDGTRETRLLDQAKIEAVLKAQRSHPPALLRDAAGRDHVLVLDQGRELPALLDYNPTGMTTVLPTTVFALPSTKGELRSFTARPGANGRIAVVLAANASANAGNKPDVYALAFDGTRWGAPANITQNETRSSLVTTDPSRRTEFSKLVTFSAMYGAGAFDPAGRLALSFVNVEITTLLRETTTREGEDYFGATHSKTDIFFQKL